MAEKKQSNDAGQAEVQAHSDEATTKGYFGTLPEGRKSNESHTLKGATGK